LSGAVAIGFTGNYIDYPAVRAYYAEVLHGLGVVTLFHPLRVIAEEFPEGEMSEDVIVSEPPGGGTLL